MADPIIYEDDQVTIYKVTTPGDNSQRYYVWKPGSGPDNDRQARFLVQQAIDNWGTLTTAQKDKLLRVLARLVIGRLDGV